MYIVDVNKPAGGIDAPPPPPPQPDYPSSLRIVEQEQDLSTYLGGTPGFHVFSGLWYRNGSYCASTNAQPLGRDAKNHQRYRKL